MPLSPPEEITYPVALCGFDGRLHPAARGWSRRPLLRTGLPGPFLRRKRWNFVFVSHPEVLLAAALSNADYAGLAFVWLYDLKRRRFLELEHLSPLAVGVKLGDTLDDPARLVSRSLRFDWRRSQDSEAIELSVQAKAMKGGGGPLDLRLRIARRPQDESLNLVVPWSDTRFNYTGKLVALPAEGELRVGGESYRLAAKETLASIDCTRGLWPYRTAWRWASGAGYIGPERRRFGVNFGAGWTDGTGVVENALFIDGRVLPLWEPVEFSFDPRSLLKPWALRTTESGRVSLTFTPDYGRVQDTNLLFMRMKLDQVMGRFDGQVVLESGETLPINGLPGIAENHLARW